MEPRDLSAHSIYRPGRGIEETARELGLDPDDLVKLSSNENPLGPSPAAVDAVREGAEEMHVYPTASHTDLTAALADEWGVDPDQIWLGNGGDGALDYLARAMIEPGDRVLVPEPDFTYHAMSARYHHASVDTVALVADEGFRQTPDRIAGALTDHRIVYLTRPHNPTGSTIDLPAVRAIADRTGPETLVVVDEAYQPFADGRTAIDLLDERDDIAVLRSFSKTYGLAGLRLGYAVVPEAWADAYAAINTPFAASELACRAGLAAIDDDEHLDRTLDLVEWARSYIREHLDAPTLPSGGNFVLARVGDAARVTERARERGVLVRDCTSFGLDAYVRISVGRRAELPDAIATLNDVLATVEPV
ncbi:MAG: histidinol-phosphate transaminase [Halococcoides sp.]